MALVDLKKAFDWVPREVVWWALWSLGVNEWLVSVVKSMYEDATIIMRVNGYDNKEFGVRVGVHQGSVLSPLLFSLVLEALSREFREDLPLEMLYTAEFVFMAETEELLVEKIITLGVSIPLFAFYDRRAWPWIYSAFPYPHWKRNNEKQFTNSNFMITQNA